MEDKDSYENSAQSNFGINKQRFIELTALIKPIIDVAEHKIENSDDGIHIYNQVFKPSYEFCKNEQERLMITYHITRYFYINSIIKN